MAKSATRKKRKARTAPEPEQRATSADVREMPSGNAIKSILKTMRLGDKDRAKVNSEVSGKVRSFLNSHKFSGPVLRLLHKLDGMEDEQIADFMDEFLYGYETSGLEERGKNAPRLALKAAGDEDDEDEEDGEEEDEGEEQGEGDNVQKFPAPSSVTAA